MRLERRPQTEDAMKRLRKATSNGEWIALANVYVIWGSTYLAIRVAVETIPPFLMAAARFLVAGALLFAWAGRRGKEGDRLGPRQWLAAALIGGLLLAGGNGLLAWSEQRGVVTGVAALIIAAVPLYMAVLAAFLGEERLHRRTVAGLAIGFAGTALLVRVSGSQGKADVLGLAAVVAGSICWAAGSVLSRRVALPRRPLVATAMEMLCGGAILFAAAGLSGEFGRLHVSQVTARSWAGLAYLIVMGSLVAFSAYVWLLKNASPSLVSTYAYVNPVIAVLLGVTILDERFTGLEALASVLIVAAVAVIVLSQGRRQKTADAEIGSAA